MIIVRIMFSWLSSILTIIAYAGVSDVSKADIYRHSKIVSPSSSSSSLRSCPSAGRHHPSFGSSWIGGRDGGASFWSWEHIDPSGLSTFLQDSFYLSGTSELPLRLIWWLVLLPSSLPDFLLSYGGRFWRHGAFRTCFCWGWRGGSIHYFPEPLFVEDCLYMLCPAAVVVVSQLLDTVYGERVAVAWPYRLSLVVGLFILMSPLCSSGS
jgi:hypothetical protein